MNESTEVPMPPQPSLAYADHAFNEGEYQRRQDMDQLRLLAIFHYIMAATTGLTALFFLAYVGFGGMMVAMPTSHHTASDPPPAFMGYMFIGMGLVGTLVCAAIAGFTIKAGSDINARRGLTLIQVMACINCLHMPIGTILGVFTLIVLNRPSVRALFETRSMPSTLDRVPEIDRAAYHDR